MKKKLLSLALVLVMALTLLPTAAFAEETGDPGTGGGDPGSSPGTNSAVCDTCSQPRTHHDAVAATCTKEGTKEYWECNCGKFSAETGGTELSDVSVPMAAHNYESGKCTVCQAVDPSYTPPTTHVHSLAVVNGTPATCTTSGTQLHYKCTDSACNKLFSDPEGKNEISRPVEIPATGVHTAPTDGTGTAVDANTHTYTCTVCKTAGHTGNHTYDSSNTCTVCGFRGTPSSSYRYIDITSAYIGSYSISVTWYSDLPDGTAFDIYVDGSFRTTARPSKSSSGHFSYTLDYSYYLGDRYYTITVYARDDHSIYDSVRTYNRDYDHDYDYWYDHYYPNSTPSTNSYGIPYASQVNGRYSAAEAIRILRNKNQYNLQSDLMSSSSALDSFERLESAVKSANSVSVNVSVDRSDVPSALRSGSGFQISGAAFNASRTNSTVRLVVDGPSQNRYAGRGYQFSMTLTGVDSASSLDVPVVVSMPLPSDISASYVKVLHYHNSNVPTVITPQVSGGRIKFPLTGFSDFVVTDGGVPNYTYVSDGYGGYYVPVGSVARRSLIDEHLSVVLPIIASTTPNGYVFDDVSGTYWAAPQIAWARDGGIMTGYYDGTFRPSAGTTRQELWMVLARLSGANPADMWAAREWAMNVGITDGTNPYSPLSNQQMIAMLYRYASYRGMNLAAPTTNLSLYRDSASVSPYARTPMSWAINRGIVTGDGTGRLNPQNIATRADFAVYLYRFIQ